MKIKEKYIIVGRGEVFTISLKENGYEGLLNKDLKTFIGKDFEYEDKNYQIIGVEHYASPINNESFDLIGLLVKEKL